MILLEKNDFHKAIEPLRLVTFNNLFARSVVERKVSGKIFVDNTDNPKTFYILHPYGMGLLFGDWNNPEFNSKFKDYALNNNVRNKTESIQAFPNDWNVIIMKLFSSTLKKSERETSEKGIININTRVNFKFNRNKYINREKIILPHVEIKKTDSYIYENMSGTIDLRDFWDSKDDFLKHGVAFSAFYDSEFAATAFSPFIHDNKLEIGVETAVKFRKMGIAEIICGVLIDYCLDNSYEPVWACRLENTASHKLALKLGFDPLLEIPYYIINK